MALASNKCHMFDAHDPAACDLQNSSTLNCAMCFNQTESKGGNVVVTQHLLKKKTKEMFIDCFENGAKCGSKDK
jgi:hypothetical protein